MSTYITKKQNITRVTGILSIALGLLDVLIGVLLAISSFAFFRETELFAFVLIYGLFTIGINLIIIFLGSSILTGSSNEELLVINAGILALVMGFFGFITAVFALVSLCLRDIYPESTETKSEVEDITFTRLAERLKQYLQNGMISQSDYDKRIKELIEEHLTFKKYNK